MQDVPGGFGRSISIINRKAQGFFSLRLKELGLGPGQQAYLLALAPDESVSQEELARRLCVDKANVSRAVRGLQALGYLTRQRSAEDSRAVDLRLTADGVAARIRVEAIAAEWLALLRSALPAAEWRAAEQALARIAEALGEA